MTDGAAQSVDPAKVEAFTDTIVGALNGGAVTLMLSVGHRTGLLDAMAALPPSTSLQIAEKSGLNERYVREWLGAMVTSRIVSFDAKDTTYVLPPEHAAVLTRAASPDNLAVTAQWMPILGSVEDEIVECFRNGGGVPYPSYPRFHQTMAEESAQSVLAVLIENIVPLVDGLPEALESGIRVLDIGCGAGRAMSLLASEFPRSTFFGFDLCDEAVQLARDEAKRRGVDNVRFEVKDIANLEEEESFDLITAFDAIHDQAAPARVLSGIAKALRPSGTFLMQDIRASSHLEKNMDHPIGTLLYTISCLHCMSVSLAQNGDGLGTVWGEELALQMLRDAGFHDVSVKQLAHDIQNNYYIARKT